MRTTVVEQGKGVRAVPQQGEIARAIASVPGVAAAELVRPADGGRSRLMLRLHPGEDEQRVAWAVAATLRERFDIDLDPDAIRPRSSPDDEPGDEPDGLALVDGADGVDDRPIDRDAARPLAAVSEPVASEPITGGPVDHGPSDRGQALTDPGGIDGSGGRRSAPVVGGQPQAHLWSAREPLTDVAGHPPRAAAPTTPPIERTDAVAPGTPTAPGAPTPVADRPGGEPGLPDPAAPTLVSTRERLRRAVEDALATLGEDAAPDASPTGEHGAVESAAPVPQPPAPAPTAERDARAAIDHLEIRRGTDDVAVAVTLRHEQRRAAGRARSVHTARGRLRAVAEATVAALDALVDRPLMVTVDRIVVTDSGDDVAVSVVLTMVDHGEEHRLLGGALVRGEQDSDGAVVRATLDALNRQVTPLLSAMAADRRT